MNQAHDRIRGAFYLIQSWDWKPQKSWMGQIKAHLIEWNFVSAPERKLRCFEIRDAPFATKRLHDFPNNFCCVHVKVSAYIFSAVCSNARALCRSCSNYGCLCYYVQSFLSTNITRVSDLHGQSVSESVNGEMRWRPNPSEWEKEENKIWKQASLWWLLLYLSSERGRAALWRLSLLM